MDKQTFSMDKNYDQNKVEQKWYKIWEESGYFKPEINPDGKPYTIILPPPNANAPLHFGHAMYVTEDILIRYHRMRGFSTLWVPGSDHAGFETQFVFEKKLQAEGKSRFDYDRDTLYQMIWDYVQQNKGQMETQLRRLGFSLDWSREKFTLDPDIIKVVYRTFNKLYKDGLVYRANRLINYCTRNGTAFSDLEVNYEEKQDKLYFIKYPFADGTGSITVATTRPETMFGDTAVAVNPEDPKYKDVVGQRIILPLTGRHIPVITDTRIEKEFGTGAVKITPAHDPLDYEIGKSNDLEQITIIGFDGKLKEGLTNKFAGMYPKEARVAVIDELNSLGLVEKVEDYTHRVGVCYKCGQVIEPLLLEQWFLNVQDLKKQAIKVVKMKEVKIYPANYEAQYFQWLENLHDWNISRQTVWGIRIPAWRCLACNEWVINEDDKPLNCPKCQGKAFEQDTDTFDTWFSSGQWPYATLQTTKLGDFEKFYPTSVMETGYDILKAWVSRMVILGLYSTGKIPFENVLLHGLVTDPQGTKMSKSKGNVVSPMEIVDQYGADSARFALIYGTATGHDQILSYPKLDAMRKFSNKLWNIGRFILEFKPEDAKIEISSDGVDQEIIKKTQDLTAKVTNAIDQYRFHDGAEALYEFIWHEFADKYIESVKERRADAQPTLEYVYKTCLELLHPYMPFITEEIWQKLPHQGESIMITKWPEIK